ncbi:phage nozzle protein [Aquabacterium sp.]|uniref:phage nozzle protein n=1 Tax=Aquabacterium sp. TaxID=1872578 RepID=UPI0040379199
MSQGIPGLYNGVSQQPAVVRLPTQAELQENFHSSIVEGLGKRHPTVTLGALTSTTPNTCAVHWVNRDDREKYAVTIDDSGNILVMDLLSRQMRAVSTPDGTGYITSGDPKSDLVFLTVADYTFIANKHVTVAPSGRPPVASIQYRNLVFGNLVHGDYNFQYDITCGTTTVSVRYGADRPSAWLMEVVDGITTAVPAPRQLYAGSINELVSVVADAFKAKFPNLMVRAEGGTTVAFYGLTSSDSVPTLSWVITKIETSSTAYGAWLTATAGTTTSPGALTGTKQLFSALPSSGMAVGDLWKIQGDPNNDFSAYYVKWNGSAWEETVAPGNGLGLDAATMPHVLVRQGDGTFVFKKATWDLRPVGDTDTNPDPSFVGSQIRDVVFYRNRLGFVCGAGTSFSRASEYFHFYRASVTTLLDTDPVDLQAATPKAAQLNFAVPFQKQLLLFSDQIQLTLTATDTLTPKTGAFNQATEYACSSLAKPVMAGPMLYFVANRGKFTQVMEYYVQQYTQTNRADDVTAHVPSYIPANVFQLASSPTEDVLVALTLQERNALYVYRFYWKADEKAQASWSKWTLNAEDRIEGCNLIGSVLYMVVARPSGLYVEGIDLYPSKVEKDLPFLVYLDRKVLIQGTYNEVTGVTTWTLPYTSPVAPTLVYGGGFGSRAGATITTSFTPGTSAVTAIGNFAADKVYAGIPYIARYRFSAQFVRDSNGLAIASADFRIRTFYVYYANTGYFRTEVTPLSRDTSVAAYTGHKLGTLSAMLGVPAIAAGVFSFQVSSDSQTVKVDLVNDSHLPSFFQNAEFEALPTMRSRRR